MQIGEAGNTTSQRVCVGLVGGTCLPCGILRASRAVVGLSRVFSDVKSTCARLVKSVLGRFEIIGSPFDIERERRERASARTRSMKAEGTLVSGDRRAKPAAGGRYLGRRMAVLHAIAPW